MFSSCVFFTSQVKTRRETGIVLIPSAPAPGLRVPGLVLALPGTHFATFSERQNACPAPAPELLGPTNSQLAQTGVGPVLQKKSKTT